MEFARLRSKSWILSLGSVAAVLLVYASVNTQVPSHGSDPSLISYAVPDVTPAAPHPSTLYDHSDDNQPKCDPVQNVFFLKTHKCASSTAQNIFMRYGDTHNLTLVLPPDGNYLGHPIKFMANLSLPLPSSFSKDQYNVFCHHTRWDEKNTVELMPKNTVYASIIKDPAAMFESMYNWVNLPSRYGVNLRKFLDNPRKYYYNSTVRYFARNPMMFDFGLEFEDFEKPREIDRKIKEIHNRFSLVMLAEYMDESLVLLKELLCWSWDDVVVFRVNARKTQYKDSLSVIYQKKVRDWNKADAKLYDYFAARFDNQMKAYGIQKMYNDVEKLRNITKMWYNYCVETEISKNDTSDLRFQVWHPTVSGFQLTRAGLRDPTCIRLAMAENPYTDFLRMKLWPVQTKAMLEKKKGPKPVDKAAIAAAKVHVEFW